MLIPALSFNFTTASLDSRIVIARALNTATAVNSSGYVATVNANLPRFDYDPVTLACKGLLIEESRINIVEYCEDFSNAIWNKGFGAGVDISTNQAFGPDNQQHLDLVTSKGAGGALFQAFTIALNTTFSVSMFIREGTSTSSQLQIFNTSAGTHAAVTFGWTAGVPSTTGTSGSPTNIRYENFGGGLYRLSYTFTSRSGGDHWIVIIPDTTAGLKTLYAGYVQLEAGAFVTSYIQNLVSGTTTRNADVATITGANFSSWWVASQGGVTANFRPSTVSGIRPIIQYDDGTANEIITLRGNTTNPELYIVDDGTPQAQIDAGTIAANTDYRLTGWWATNDCKAKLDSGAIVTDTTATIPTVTQARIGSDGTNYLNGHIASLNYYGSFTGQIYTRRKNKVIFSLM